MIKWLKDKLTGKRSAPSSSQPQQEPLVPVFVPSLAAVLAHHETLKGEPLSEQEVYDITGDATVVMMRSSEALKLDESRGYRDIDPENGYQDWLARKEEVVLKEQERIKG